MRASGWVVAAAMVMFAPAASAQEALTLEDALKRARTHGREIAAARARLEGIEAGVGQARSALLPSIAAQGRYTHNYEEATLEVPESFTPPITTRTITIQQEDQLDGVIAANVPLLSPAAWASLDAARKSHAAAEASTAAAETDVLLGVARAFYGAAGADEVLQAMTNSVVVAKRTLEDARARVEAGTRNRVEVTRAELALERAQQSRLEAADARDRAYRLLATLLDLEPGFRVQPAEATGAAPATDELAREAASRRPEIRALRATVEANAAQAKAATWRSLPVLSAFGNARLSSYEGFTGDPYAWAAGAQLDWSLFDGGARYAQARSARAQKRDAEIRLALLEDQVRDEVANARASVDVKRAALESAKRSVALSKESLDLIRAQTDAGRATQLDLLQAQDALVAAEVQLARARFDLGLAQLELRRAAGTFE